MVRKYKLQVHMAVIKTHRNIIKALFTVPWRDIASAPTALPRPVKVSAFRAGLAVFITLLLSGR
jgi:hypothetical protein